MNTVVFLVWISTVPNGTIAGVQSMPSLLACEEVGKWWDATKWFPKTKWTCMEIPDGR